MSHFNLLFWILLSVAGLNGQVSAGVAGQEVFRCPPGSAGCDTLPFDQPGACSHCGVTLIMEEAFNEQQKSNLRIAFYLQDGVEVLDFAGPMEVFAYAGFEVFTVSKTKGPITSQGILKVLPDYTLANAPKADVLAFFGGNSGAAAGDPAVIEWVRSREDVRYYFSVCTGAFVLGEAGLLDGQTATTFHRSIDELRKRYPRADVRSDVRFVDNGRVITTAGISAGIDGALHLVQKVLGKKRAEQAARYMEYDKWQPEEGLIIGESRR